MMTTHLYLSHDTSALAAGAGGLADAWSERPEIQLIRTPSRGAFFLEPMVEQDSPNGREAWFNVALNDLPRIVSGVGGDASCRGPVSATDPLHLCQLRHHRAARAR